MKVCSVEEMRSFDKKAIEDYGISQELLMENAGIAAFEVIKNKIGIDSKCFLVVCGPGNKGGDGLVVARKIHSAKGKVKIVLLANKSKFKGSAAKNFQIVEAIGLEIIDTNTTTNFEKEIEKTDVIIDAIFGTGLSRDIKGFYYDVIEKINKSGKIVISLDIPSGINGNTGKIMGISIEAHYTITFGLPKLGNVLYPGFEKSGKTFVSHISFPPKIYDSLTFKLNTLIPLIERAKAGHKKTFGEVVFIAGSKGYFGAPYLSALSFLKAGGGYSRLATANSIIPTIASIAPEIVFEPMEETDFGSISYENKNKLLEITKKMKMTVIGPGISIHEETQQLVRELISEIKTPILIDGDGLTAVSKNSEILNLRERSTTVLTPHLGEMSRLTNIPVDEIKNDLVNILIATCKKFKSIIVLKGPHSLIGNEQGDLFVNMTGNSGMATAGSGDVLSGIIPALFGLGHSLTDSVRIGVFIHGLAADIVTSKKGVDGITAKDIMNCLPLAIKTTRKNIQEVQNNYELDVL